MQSQSQQQQQQSAQGYQPIQSSQTSLYQPAFNQTSLPLSAQPPQLLQPSSSRSQQAFIPKLTSSDTYRPPLSNPYH